MRYVGIDPGLEGGIGFVEVREEKLYGWSSMKMPRSTVRYSMAGKVFNMVDIVPMHQSIAEYRPHALIVERQVGRPNQSSVATHTAGTNYGLILSLSLLKISTHIVAPDQWKKTLGLSADKGEAIDLCREVFGPASPAADGPAEALLIAWYGIKEKLE